MLSRLPPLVLIALLAAPALAAQAAAPPAVAGAAAPAITMVETPASRKARQVIATAIAAMGGDHYLQANERSGHGLLYTFDSNGQLRDAAVRFWDYHRFPADERIELTKKRNVIDIFAGGKGWEITYKGVAPVQRKQLRAYNIAAAHSLDVILKTWAADPGTLMLDEGISTVDQTQVDSVDFTTQSGLTATVDFSIMSHLPVRVRWHQLDPETGGHYEESIVYGDWVPIGAITTPFTVSSYEGNERQSQRFYNGVSFAPLPAAIFVPKPLHH